MWYYLDTWKDTPYVSKIMYMYMNNIDDNAMTISGRFAEDYDKKKKEEGVRWINAEEMYPCCQFVQKLCDPRRHGDVIVAKDSLLSYQKDALCCHEEWGKNWDELTTFKS